MSTTGNTGGTTGNWMVPFRDPRREYLELTDELERTIARVMESGWYILGSRLEEFENAFSEYLGEGVFCAGVGSGTEAIHLSLLASGVGPGDFVITVPNTAVPTVAAIVSAGATPLLCDVKEEDFTMDTADLEERLSGWKRKYGSKVKAVIPVHLYGQTAQMDEILRIAREFDLIVIEDACQAHGAGFLGRKAGTFGDLAAFSFYPTKNLGCYGDGGMVVTRNRDMADKLKMLRNYGQEQRYYFTLKGVNSRLDEIQAAMLRVKLRYLDEWNQKRRHLASVYNRGIVNPSIRKPVELSGRRHVYHLYVIRHPERDSLMKHLEKHGIQTLIHYPVPVHLQKAYRDLGLGRGCFPVAEALAEEILSLPLYPQIRHDEIERVIEVLNEFQDILV